MGRIGKKVHVMLRTLAKFFVLELVKVTFLFTKALRTLDIIIIMIVFF